MSQNHPGYFSCQVTYLESKYQTSGNKQLPERYKKTGIFENTEPDNSHLPDDYSIVFPSLLATVHHDNKKYVHKNL